VSINSRIKERWSFYSKSVASEVHEGLARVAENLF
jgi:hypothetical protein